MINTQFVDVTPQFAEYLLGMNTNNYRKPDQRRVDLYARQMANGLWQNNCEPIHIADDGTLVNGQHRLLAVVKSGATVKMLLVTGVEKNSIYDVGGVRTTQQILKANGQKITSQEACAIGMLCDGFEARYGAQEIMKYYRELEHFDPVSKAITKGGKHPITLKGGVIAAAYCAYFNGVVSVEEIEQFATICNSGIPTQENNGFAPLCFRRTLQDGIKNTNGETVTGGTRWRIALFETAYRAITDFKHGIKRTRNYKPDGTGKQTLYAVRKKKGWA